jgi:membrane-associated phospholipid phosphatase
VLVPGYGPYRAIAGEFQHALPSGMWLNVVMEAVAEGGAQKDIFPSLHTAAPTFIALYSFRHRALPPYRYTWPLVLFFAANIIVATMFLRWHWLVDVVAGLALAVTSQVLSVWVTEHELVRRARERLVPTWPEFGRRS